jgi:hypothetical protein
MEHLQIISDPKEQQKGKHRHNSTKKKNLHDIQFS